MLTPDRVLEHALAFQRSAILLSAHEVGLFAELAERPRPAEPLGRRLGLRQDAVADLLDALVTLGLVECSEGNYHNTREASLYLDPTKPTYIGGWLAMAGAAMRAMANLTTQLRADGVDRREQPALATQMWSDIAGILSEAWPSEGS
jgi:hypothetical protein